MNIEGKVITSSAAFPCLADSGVCFFSLCVHLHVWSLLIHYTVRDEQMLKAIKNSFCGRQSCGERRALTQQQITFVLRKLMMSV